MELLEKGLSEDHQISRGCWGTIGPINQPDMASLVASTTLQNAIKYRTKVVHKTGKNFSGAAFCLSHQLVPGGHLVLL